MTEKKIYIYNILNNGMAFNVRFRNVSTFTTVGPNSLKTFNYYLAYMESATSPDMIGSLKQKYLPP